MASPLGFWKSSGEIWTRSEMVVYVDQYFSIGVIWIGVFLQG